jgi:hypothetical protein
VFKKSLDLHAFDFGPASLTQYPYGLSSENPVPTHEISESTLDTCSMRILVPTGIVAPSGISTPVLSLMILDLYITLAFAPAPNPGDQPHTAPQVGVVDNGTESVVYAGAVLEKYANKGISPVLFTITLFAASTLATLVAEHTKMKAVNTKTLNQLTNKNFFFIEKLLLF